MKKSVSIKDVAKTAGVSVGTVSRFYNMQSVSAILAAKVRSAAAELGYQPSKKTRRAEEIQSRDVVILVSQKMPRLGIWTQQIIYGIFCALSRYGYRSIVEFIPENAVYSVPRTLQKTDGCIVWGEFSEDFYKVLRRTARNLPVVSYSRDIPYENSIAVIGTPYESMRKALEYLLACGHRRIAYVTWETPDTMRHRAFENMLKEYGHSLDRHLIFDVNEHGLKKDGDAGSVTGYLATQELFQHLDQCPTAVIYEHDRYAQGGMEALKEMKFRIPEDVSVMGFDGIIGSEETFPPLTSMKMDPDKVGLVIAENLDKLWMNKPHEKVVRLTRELIKRQSAGPAPVIEKKRYNE